MFTGLVEDVGEVLALQRRDGGVRLVLGPAKLPTAELALGESVAVDGCCLTVVERSAGRFSADVSPETLAHTGIGGYAVGRRVNLERALRLGDRLGGHLVLGHVDATGALVGKRETSGYWELTFEAPKVVAGLLLPKGSVTIDGVSLTVNGLQDRGDGSALFTVMIVPTTQRETTLGDRRTGDRVNLEGDVIGKYVARLQGRGGDGLTVDKLREAGFA